MKKKEGNHRLQMEEINREIEKELISMQEDDQINDNNEQDMGGFSFGLFFFYSMTIILILIVIIRFIDIAYKLIMM